MIYYWTMIYYDKNTHKIKMSKICVSRYPVLGNNKYKYLRI